MQTCAKSAKPQSSVQFETTVEMRGGGQICIVDVQNCRGGGVLPVSLSNRLASELCRHFTCTSPPTHTNQRTTLKHKQRTQRPPVGGGVTGGGAPRRRTYNDDEHDDADGEAGDERHEVRVVRRRLA